MVPWLKTSAPCWWPGRGSPHSVWHGRDLQVPTPHNIPAGPEHNWVLPTHPGRHGNRPLGPQPSPPPSLSASPSPWWAHRHPVHVGLCRKTEKCPQSSDGHCFPWTQPTKGSLQTLVFESLDSGWRQQGQSDRNYDQFFLPNHQHVSPPPPRGLSVSICTGKGRAEDVTRTYLLGSSEIRVKFTQGYQGSISVRIPHLLVLSE